MWYTSIVIVNGCGFSTAIIIELGQRSTAARGQKKYRCARVIEYRYSVEQFKSLIDEDIMPIVDRKIQELVNS